MYSTMVSSCFLKITPKISNHSWKKNIHYLPLYKNCFGWILTRATKKKRIWVYTILNYQCHVLILNKIHLNIERLNCWRLFWWHATLLPMHQLSFTANLRSKWLSKSMAWLLGPLTMNCLQRLRSWRWIKHLVQSGVWILFIVFWSMGPSGSIMFHHVQSCCMIFQKLAKSIDISTSIVIK